MAKRGWNREAIDKLIQNPASARSVRDTRHLPGRGRMDDPATAYINRQGPYGVRNERTGAIVQVSDRFDLDWVSPW
jgi:filamentous hemagglutinin